MNGHLRHLTEDSTKARIAECAPTFRPMVIATLSAIEWQTKAKSRNGFVARVFEAWRSTARQMEHFAKGRIKTPLGWIVTDKSSVVTNLKPENAPHCTVTKDDGRGALAVDIWLLDDMTGKLLGNTHPAWSLIPAAAYLACGIAVESGAFWNQPRDWGHLQARDWEKLCLVQHSGMPRMLREVAV